MWTNQVARIRRGMYMKPIKAPIVMYPHASYFHPPHPPLIWRHLTLDRNAPYHPGHLIHTPRDQPIKLVTYVLKNTDFTPFLSLWSSMMAWIEMHWACKTDSHNKVLQIHILNVTYKSGKCLHSYNQLKGGCVGKIAVFFCIFVRPYKATASTTIILHCYRGVWHSFILSYFLHIPAQHFEAKLDIHQCLLKENISANLKSSWLFWQNVRWIEQHFGKC